MNIRIDDRDYEVIIEKKNNKNSYIRVKDDLKIYVTTSRYSTKHDIERMLKENIDAIKKMLDKKISQLEKKERFFYLGNSYDIIEVSIMEDIEIDGNKIYIPSKKKFDLWYKKEINKTFNMRYQKLFEWFSARHPMNIPTLKIRSMKTRWGVYNRKNHSVTLNSHLIEYDIEKLDYVIIHELSHTIHFDHSKEFWNLVSEYCPNYKSIRKELKE